ncbi:hypothetical protein BCV44_21950 [Vibrio cyclitrophicus]|uniref:hypothetical protein n=1 Tax=Vibrio cyclitrophicus TaxID=47951 RepID=UPI000C858B7E|nr:hypothetical protein [Vibrio cyclitrophicus]PME09972.1 hypothetical protein BCV44_21950 [Vibrio cyclitrophicus]
MFQLLIGFIVGLFVGFTIFVLLLINHIEIDMSVVTNAVIAFATVFATTIHYSSIKQQRRDRLWDMNKPILLGLSKSLSDVIKASEYHLQREYADRYMDDTLSFRDKPSPNVYEDFSQKREYALEVYGLLMDKELIDALKHAKRINDDVEEAVNMCGFDHITAYDESISANRNLQKKLSFFIAKMSGVQDI